jgi:hypothetical protein
MTEAELIEISQRFRKLSDALDQADVYLKECEEKETDPDDEEVIVALRAELYRLCVQCSDDLERMQTLIRKQAK